MTLKNSLLAFAYVLSFGISAPTVSFAESQLTIISENATAEIVLTDDELMALPQLSITTGTPWTEMPMVYEGPTLWSVLERVEAIGSDIELVALNDYKVRLTADRITEDWPIVARLQNGETMSIREKGPYWLMFPFDNVKELQTETFFSLSIWQLAKIELLE
ncbi:oxidoreductase [Ponticoccus sp. SC2-23]|uniref:oxidoreductase n=1 Tax=Alexandriicola marinus TaxID=2081710 RepID=UPI000FD82B35|nr:oxidoreductase [Alexandriicola marinus]MBM1221017.1 oxidoreductase [Ponticoccus sp. SC6-9]MBM1225587.1 oxidoreductase [Ponticoccus sp. SC6-15]MBM1227739.1 oxidoreductase [Ponticoccus sp. SC6-38]MBM1234623.1 oxidoreductase [Ponticoccus sp. SC6-45]MBM1238241.1 oxidoreductase [Ponticoccus sp. SC6-49]MBM1243510.1 oxidoreductase [Ponticoccus sp. SC2-64]MBM1248147.1 oxidoreductase [Ponticoccus sp. SC6-42]MBM1252641.1 oxidoreductase [Ponticoccus sp. SC6-33]MBM1256250.1 oxidoreductase [Ponticoc